MRVIVDTNIFVSGLLTRTGPPGRIVDAILAGRIKAVFSDATFAELGDVLTRPRLQRLFAKAGVEPAEILECLRVIAGFATPGRSNDDIRDPKDRPFLELAAGSPPADLLVTGDKDFVAGRYGAVPVVTAAQLAELMDADREGL